MNQTPQELWQTQFLSDARGIQHIKNSSKHFFWVNPLNTNSLRLTFSGFQWIRTSTNILNWEVKLSDQLTIPILLKLEKSITSPYYVRGLEKDLRDPIIWFFDQQHVIMLALHAGNIEKYLDDLLIKDHITP